MPVEVEVEHTMDQVVPVGKGVVVLVKQEVLLPLVAQPMLVAAVVEHQHHYPVAMADLA